MDVIEITPKEYEALTPNECFCYSKSTFSELNKSKADQVSYFLIQDHKPRFLLTVGKKEGSSFCPFSAPFGMLLTVKKDPGIKDYWEAIQSLDDYFHKIGIKSMRFVLPPFFYCKEELDLLISALYGNGYKISWIDINYQFDLKKLDVTKYLDNIAYNAKKNLKIAIQMNLKLKLCKTEKEKLIAYTIIRKNREAKGYPLRMSFQQVMETSEQVAHDFFLVVDEKKHIASAVVFHVNHCIAQVIYWGDRPGYSNKKPINFLAYELVKYYQDKNFAYLDIGPSTEYGVPNMGLCDFKASIGCETDTKFTFQKDFFKLAESEEE